MPKEEVTPKAKNEAADDDEEFFEQHGIKEDEDKEVFRKRYLLDEYKDYRNSKKKTKEPEKKKSSFWD